MPGKQLAPVKRPVPERVKPPKPIVPVDNGIEATIPRDRWDRPLIIPPDGGAAEAYVRCTTIAETLDDKHGLHLWQLRRAAVGFSRRPDLTLAAAVLDADLDADKRALGILTDQAMEAAGTSAAATNGTTVHVLTERIDKGLPLPQHLPDNIRAMLRAYQRAMKPFEVIDTEQFVVNDRLKVGGTYDKRLRHKKTGKVYVGDTKTGKRVEYLGMKTCQQVAIYEEGEHYELDGTRTPFESDHDKGVLIWLPYADTPEDAYCELFWLDLNAGRTAVEVALMVRQVRALKKNEWITSI